MGQGRRVVAVVALAWLTSLSVAAAQRTRGDGEKDAKPLEPVVASTMLRNAEAYEGKDLSLMGVVVQRLSGSAFAMGQGKADTAGRDILILAPSLTGSVEPGSTVTVIGAALRFEPGDARWAKSALDLPAEVAAKYRGRIVVLATAVVNHETVDVARRRPAAAAADSAANAPAPGLKCVFPIVAAGTWVGGAPKVEIKAATMSIGFDSINTEEGTARAIGQFGASDIIVRASEGNRHFLQVFRTGALYATTVFDTETRDGKLRAVHARHEAAGVSEYYGECEVVK